MTDKKTKPSTKELSNEELDNVQGGVNNLTVKSTDKEVAYECKLDKASIRSYDLGGD